MLLIGYKNVATQTLDELELINFGTVYRAKDCATFKGTSVSPILSQKGIYHITAIISYTVTAETDFQLLQDNEAVTGALFTAPAGTGTAVIDYYVLVPCTTLSLGATSIAVQLVGGGATITNAILNITKEA